MSLALGIVFCLVPISCICGLRQLGVSPFCFFWFFSPPLPPLLFFGTGIELKCTNIYKCSYIFNNIFYLSILYILKNDNSYQHIFEILHCKIYFYTQDHNLKLTSDFLQFQGGSPCLVETMMTCESLVE